MITKAKANKCMYMFNAEEDTGSLFQLYMYVMFLP